MLETELDITNQSRPGPVLRSADEAAALLQALIGSSDREQFVALYLNARHAVTHAHIVSRGAVASSPVHPREVFKGAVLANSSALIIGHNHPSGDVAPSPEDEAITERLREAGELLGIELLDSLIVGPSDEFYCFASGRVERVDC